jgi:flagellar basal body-associated protein FliL
MKKDAKEEEKIKHLVKDGWERARSRVFEILTGQSAASLNTPEGKMQVRRLISDELTVTFFRKGEAVVTTIYWDEFFIG